MKSFHLLRIANAAAMALASLVLLSAATAFSPSSLQHHQLAHATHASTPALPSSTSALPMSLMDVSDFYADFPLQAAVLTCGVKASVADGIAQVRKPSFGCLDDLEVRRNLAYIVYGGIFVGAMCHYEYDVIFPLLFGNDHSLWTSMREVLFDVFVSGPLLWLPPAYLIKAVMYDYPLQEGLQKYANDVMKNGLLLKYWAVWLPAQSISFTVVPDHLRIVFMASVSFFWFILFSTVASATSDSAPSDDGNANALD